MLRIVTSRWIVRTDSSTIAEKGIARGRLWLLGADRCSESVSIRLAWRPRERVNTATRHKSQERVQCIWFGLGQLRIMWREAAT